MSAPPLAAPGAQSEVVLAERRAKPFGRRFEGTSARVPKAFVDPELAAKVSEGDVAGARARAVAQLRTRPAEASAYEDAVLLARADPGFTWDNWAVAGMSACPELAPRLIALVPEGELAEFAVRTHLPWSALRHQADGGAALHLFSLRIGTLLLRGELDPAFAAVVEPLFIAHGARDPAARAILIGVASVLTWREAAQGAQAAAMLRVARAEQGEAAEEPYPLDLLEDARQLSALVRRVAARAPLPPALVHALWLGPLFAGAALRALLDELAAALRAEAPSFLRCCDAVIEVSPPLAVFLADVFVELHHEAPPTDVDGAAPAREPAVLAQLARSEARRKLTATLAALGACAALGVLAPGGQLDLAFVIAAPLALAAWALLSHVPRLLYASRVRIQLARLLAADSRNVRALAAALATPALRALGARVQSDPALELLAALASGRGILPRKE